MQQFLKGLIRPARTRVTPAELFEEFFVAMDDAMATLHMRLGRVSAAALTRAFESKAVQDDVSYASTWKPPCKGSPGET